MRKYEPALHQLCRDLAKEAHLAYCKCITPVMYLYGFPDEHHAYDELKLSRDKVRFADLVLCEPIPRDRDEDSLKVWFLDRLRRQPILPVIDKLAENNSVYAHFMS